MRKEIFTKPIYRMCIVISKANERLKNNLEIYDFDHFLKFIF